MTFDSDDQIFEFCRTRLYTAVVCDVLDSLGYRDQAMRSNIRPIHPDHVVVGRAKTILWLDLYEILDNPYEMEIKAIDSLKPGEVTVHCAHQSEQNAPWGELMSTAARMRGSTGAIVDGLIRDVKKIIEMGFPVFAVGFRPLDSKGRGLVVDFDVPIRCGDVLVRPGDLVFGDYDGVVVVPREVEAEVWPQAWEKVTGENKTREELLQGALLSEVYARYGVL